MSSYAIDDAISFRYRDIAAAFGGMRVQADSQGRWVVETIGGTSRGGENDDLPSVIRSRVLMELWVTARDRRANGQGDDA